MNRKCLILLIMLSAVFSSKAQNNSITEYYKLTKIYTNGKGTEQSGNSGQFITRTNKYCYDSNNKGYSVENGSLELVSKQGNASKYFGTCYYGSDCYYTFFDDKGVLNIQTDNGKVYVYKKAAPPAGRTTCSLIKSSGGYYDGGVSAPSVSYGGSSTQTSSSSTSKHTCMVCGGKGRKIKEYYSGGKFKYCGECGREVTLGHNHVMCDNCSGLGYINY